MNRQRYDCPDCDGSKLLPEHPRYGPRTIRTGCEQCGRITRHRAAGRIHEPVHLRPRKNI